MGQQLLEVRMRNPAHVGPYTMRAATREASRIMATAGVEVTWNSTAAGSPGLGQAKLTVTIVRDGGGGVPGDVLGYAWNGPCSGAQVTILFDRIELLERAGVIHASTMLGHALAHEIGHVLLGEGHSTAGIMNGLWGLPEYLQAAQGQLKFSTSQRRAIADSYAGGWRDCKMAAPFGLPHPVQASQPGPAE
jgi:hypothetical protein